MMFEIGEVICGTWKVLDYIGRGSQGSVLRVVGIQNCLEAALKVAPLQKQNKLFNEAKLYNHIKQNLKHAQSSVPQLHMFRRLSDCEIMVIDLLGPSLQQLRKFKESSFSRETVLLLFLRALECIEKLHNAGIIHKDIKPGNICVGRGRFANRLYLVDLGLSCISDDHNGSEPQKGLYDDRTCVGTPIYASLGVLKGNLVARKDDLESLCYTMMRLYKDEIPRGSRKDLNSVLLRCIGWRERSITEMCREYPNFFSDFLEYVRNLDTDEKPDYEILRQLLELQIKQNGGKTDDCFEWLKKRTGEVVDCSDISINKLYNNVSSFTKHAK